MVQLLQSRTQTIVPHKIRVHANVDGNEQTNAVIKQRCKLDHRFATTLYEHALPTPYHLQINQWHSMQKTPRKGLITHLGKHILEHDKRHNLTTIAYQTHQSHKWLENKDFEKIMSNDLWKTHYYK